MKAAVIFAYGGPEQLVVTEVDDPYPGPGQVLVDVRAASVNGADFKVRRGRGRYELAFPHILGRDFSGVVSALGPGVDDVDVGAEVFGVLEQGHEGAYAQKLTIDARIVLPKPPGLSHSQAAAVALTGITAVAALEDCAELAAGETILIHGGAGGVGGFAIQLARRLGGRVITTASLENHRYVRGLGADQAIDYRSTDFLAVAPPCDVVFDTVGGEVQTRSYAALKRGGRLVRIADGPADYHPTRRDVVVLRPDVKRDRAHLARVVALIAEGAVRPPPIQIFSLDDVARAHEISENRHLMGKLVIQIA